MKKYLLAASPLVLCCGLFAAWFLGELAPLYADIPDRPQLPTVRPNIDPLIIGHRGDSHSAPENTIPAIKAAIEGGLDYVELDIRLTADGVPVLMHDSDVSRTTDGEGAISRKTYAEIRALDAGSWFSENFSGTSIPSLEKALSTASGSICVLADLKGQVNKLVVDLLKDFAEEQRSLCLLISPVGISGLGQFDGMKMPDDARKKLENNTRRIGKLFDHQYRTFVRSWPEFPLARSVNRSTTPVDLLGKYPSLVAIEINISLVNSQLVDEAHSYGLLTYMRVVTQHQQDSVYRDVLNTGLDGLFISDVGGLKNFLDTYSAEAH
jgi:glycerophosphoryl diester phosphodiesterase